MQRLVHTLALGAVLVTLVASIWQDWSTLSTIKRMVVSYLGFYFLGGGLTLAVRLVGSMEDSESESSGQTATDEPPTA